MQWRVARDGRLGKSTIFYENRGFRFGGVQKTKILKSMPLWRIENPLICMQFACYTPPPGCLTRHAEPAARWRIRVAAPKPPRLCGVVGLGEDGAADLW